MLAIWDHQRQRLQLASWPVVRAVDQSFAFIGRLAVVCTFSPRTKRCVLGSTLEICGCLIRAVSEWHGQELPRPWRLGSMGTGLPGGHPEQGLQNSTAGSFPNQDWAALKALLTLTSPQTHKSHWMSLAHKTHTKLYPNPARCFFKGKYLKTLLSCIHCHRLRSAFLEVKFKRRVTLFLPSLVAFLHVFNIFW